MFYAALALAAGVLSSRYLPRPNLLWLIVTVLFLAGAAIFCHGSRRVCIVFALVAFVPCGALLYQLSWTATEPLPSLSAYTSQESVIEAHVVRATLPRTGGESILQTVDVVTESVSQDGHAGRVEAGIRINFFATERQSALPDFRYGDRLRLRAKLREPRNYGNPGAMDYRGYLRDRGIVALASVRSDKVERLPGHAGTPLGIFRDNLRSSLTRQIFSLAERDGVLVSLSREDAGLLAAMILGEQSLLHRETKADFQRTGTYHILVVSGMNVGILAFVIFGMCRWLRAGEYSATVVTIVLSLFYAYVTDMGAPILRASLMLSLYLGARLLYRERYSLNAIGTAALILLIFAPKALFEPSFQLTFMSVLVLGGITQPLLERTTLPYIAALRKIELTGVDVALAPRLAQFRLDLRMIASRLAVLISVAGLFSASTSAAVSRQMLVLPLRAVLYLWNLAVVTGLMQVALALPMVIYFHRLSVLGLPTNMLVIPLTGVLLPVAVLSMLLSYVSEALARFPLALTAVSLRVITTVVECAGGLAFADMRVPTPDLLLALTAATAFMVALFAMRKHRAIAAPSVALLAGVAAVIAIGPSPRFRTGVAEMTVIDVGQGDSILVISPDGRTLLMDAGGPLGFMRETSNSFDIGEDVVSAYLWSRGIARLDVVALSHAHSDHIGGLPAVLHNFRPRELWLGSQSDNEKLRRVLHEAQLLGTEVRQLRAGDDLQLGAVRLRVLAPGFDSPVLTQLNDESLVLELSYGRSKALLTGDAERQSEQRIARLASDVDVLKVAHHGSASSTTPELLAVSKPEIAVISAGYRNIYGHPKPVVVERLISAGARVYRTDMNGAVSFLLDGEKVSVETYGMH